MCSVQVMRSRLDSRNLFRIYKVRLCAPDTKEIKVRTLGSSQLRGRTYDVWFQREHRVQFKHSQTKSEDHRIDQKMTWKCWFSAWTGIYLKKNVIVIALNCLIDDKMLLSIQQNSIYRHLLCFLAQSSQFFWGIRCHSRDFCFSIWYWIAARTRFSSWSHFVIPKDIL